MRALSILVIPTLFWLAACDRTPVRPAGPEGLTATEMSIQPGLGFEQVPLSRAAEAAAAEEAAETANFSDDPLADELSQERAMQLELPTADGPMWRVLRQTRISIDETTQLFEAVHPAAVRTLAGQRIKLQGYMLPLEANDRTAHFLISPYTPVCFFHPPAEPNEVIEVRLGRPISAGYHLVEVTGVLTLADNGEKGLFFQMNGATARVVERVDGML
jgi:hypothetical protein